MTFKKIEIYNLNLLSINRDLETKQILKKIVRARAALAELQGLCASIPDENILINTLALQEAKDSSAIENIITTHDEIYCSDTFSKEFINFAAKEVHSYAVALREGFKKVRETGLLTNKYILEIQATLENNQAGFRKLPGTTLKNDQTGEIIYTPPQDHQDILELMSNLEEFINDDNLVDWDPLVKMAVIHHQFESIHPFYDGNGRTGRIINILYLVKQKLLNNPVLYLSRYINQNKSDYYHLLQKVRTEDSWDDWLIYMLTGIEKTAQQTMFLIKQIRNLMLYQKEKILSECPKIYTQDLLNILFTHPYSKIEFLVREMRISRITAAKYLEELENIGLIRKIKKGKINYYMNIELFNLFQNIPKI